MNFAINGEHIKKATQDITKRLDGFKYEEALEVLDRVAFQLKANATISIPSKESNADNKENAVLKRQLEEQRYIGKDLAVESEGETVMGIKGELFTTLMDLLHDLSSRFRGERYTIEIDVSPEWVKVKKVS